MKVLIYIYRFLWEIYRNLGIKGNVGASSSPGLSSPSISYFDVSVLNFYFAGKVGKVTIVSHSQCSNFLRKDAVSSPIRSNQSIDSVFSSSKCL